MILEQLQARIEQVGPLQKTDSTTSVRFVVHRAWTYLTNHQDKMKYAQYRREGLPITTCNVETTVKQVNYRVKGTEKFWSDKGSQAMLQLRADALSDDQPLMKFWKCRVASMTGFRNYKKTHKLRNRGLTFVIKRTMSHTRDQTSDCSRAIASSSD